MKKEKEMIRCPVCGREDTTLNPVLEVSNATEYDEKYACSECVSIYDGTFAWKDEKVVYV